VKPLEQNGFNPQRTILFDDSLHKTLPHERENVIVLPSFREGHELDVSHALSAQDWLLGSAREHQRQEPSASKLLAPTGPATQREVPQTGLEIQREDPFVSRPLVPTSHATDGILPVQQQRSHSIVPPSDDRMRQAGLQTDGGTAKLARHGVQAYGEAERADKAVAVVEHGPGWGPEKVKTFSAAFDAVMPPVERCIREHLRLRA
jgi:hypothetical protein